MSAQDSATDVGAALPKARRDILPLLLPVALVVVHQEHPEGLHVHRGGPELGELVDLRDLLVAHGLVGERVGGAGLGEEQLLGLERQVHAWCHALDNNA